MSARKLFGIPSSRYDELEYASIVGGVPNAQWYWAHTNQNQDLVNTISWYADFEISYVITFYDRKDPEDAIEYKPRPHWTHRNVDTGVITDLSSGVKIRLEPPEPGEAKETKEERKEEPLTPPPSPELSYWSVVLPPVKTLSPVPLSLASSSRGDPMGVTHQKKTSHK
jgi:hypothetical protein